MSPFICMSQRNVLDHGFVELLDIQAPLVKQVSEPCSRFDSAIVASARVSTGGRQRRPDHVLLNYLVKHEHSSPFEMVETWWRMKMPIFVARQLVRHRTASVNEESARYTEPEMEFYIPENMRAQSKTNKQSSDGKIIAAAVAQVTMQEVSESSHEGYKELIAMGLSRELARLVLPVNTYTSWIFKIDLRNLLHLFELRCAPSAQWETQQYANAMREMITPYVPVTIKAWEEHRA